MAIRIQTNDYVKDRNIEIDGNYWTLKMVGAGTELKMSQAQRRLTMLSKKIDNGTATEDEYEAFDRLEKEIYNTFSVMINDGTDENESVKRWINDTPTIVIMKIFEDIKKQIDKEEEFGDNTGTIGENTTS